MRARTPDVTGLNIISNTFIMSEPDPKTLIALYNTMESQLELLGITFDEFSVLYQTFKATIAAAGVDTKAATEEQKEEAVAPFPWMKYAGYGKYS